MAKGIWIAILLWIFYLLFAGIFLVMEPFSWIATGIFFVTFIILCQCSLSLITNRNISKKSRSSQNQPLLQSPQTILKPTTYQTTIQTTTIPPVQSKPNVSSTIPLPPQFCPGCGGPIYPSEHICPKCGFHLDAGKHKMPKIKKIK